MKTVYTTKKELFNDMKKIVDLDVESYLTDFTITDMKIIKKAEPGEAYIWFTRKAGTHMLPYPQALIANTYDSAAIEVNIGRSIHIYLLRFEKDRITVENKTIDDLEKAIIPEIDYSQEHHPELVNPKRVEYGKTYEYNFRYNNDWKTMEFKPLEFYKTAYLAYNDNIKISNVTVRELNS